MGKAHLPCSANSERRSRQVASTGYHFQGGQHHATELIGKVDTGYLYLAGYARWPLNFVRERLPYLVRDIGEHRSRVDNGIETSQLIDFRTRSPIRLFIRSNKM